MIDLGSYGTADSQGSSVEGVYVHRITQKPSTSSLCPQGETGNCGAALVAAPTCRFGRSVTDITVNNLQVNDLGNDINSVNRPFNIGLGSSYGASGIEYCNGIDTNPPSAIETNITELTFTNFGIYTGALANSTFYYRFTEPVNSKINEINFFVGPVNASVKDKVAIYPGDGNFAYFICGPPASPLGCWNTSGVGGKANPTFENVTYDSSGKFTRINFPYTPPTP